MKRPSSAKLSVVLLFSAICVGALTLSLATSSLATNFIIVATGKIQPTASITARSGSAEDIQAAVDQVAATTGTGNVYIPEGRFNFVDEGESWTGARVVVPAGVNLFGATTEKDVYGQVIEWKTILQMPWDEPGVNTPIWFRVEGSSDPNEPSRISDIKFVGYKTADSISCHMAISMGGGNKGGVIDFRVDHCSFLNLNAGIFAVGSEIGGPFDICGVIDHCRFVNEVGDPAGPDAAVGYGVFVGRGGGWGSSFEPWDDDVDNILGQYTSYTVFVEDCYFKRWRHCIAVRSGAHGVFRHNTIENDWGYGSIDIHGDSPGRALEIYENTLIDPLGPDPGFTTGEAVWFRAGAGVIFNNVVQGYNLFTLLHRENPDSKYWPHKIWVWDNNLGGLDPVEPGNGNGPSVEDVDYFLYEKPNYIPYPYPHPLTFEATP